MVRPRPLRPYHIVAGNLRKRPFRTMATIFTFALIAATLYSSLYLINGTEQSLDAGISRLGADLLVVPEGNRAAGEAILLTGQPNTFFFDDVVLEKVSSLPGVRKASPQIFIATLFASCCAAPVQMIAIDQERDFTVTPWLRQKGAAMGKDDMIIGSSIIQNVGNDLFFFGHTFHVIGVLERTGTGIDNSVFVRFEDAATMAEESDLKAVTKLTIPPGRISAVLVRVEPGSQPSDVARTVEQEVPGTRAITPDGLLNSVSIQFGAVTRLLYGASLAITIAAVPLLGSISALVARERLQEVSVLRALGASGYTVIGLMFAESSFLALAGGVTGIAAATSVLILFQDFIATTLSIPLAVPGAAAILANTVLSLLLLMLISGISSFYPALLITRSEPYDAIRRGEP